MLHEFLTANHTELVSRCRNKMATRFAPAPTPLALDPGVALFLDQLVDVLRLEQHEPHSEHLPPQPTPAPTKIGRAAAIHGANALRLGYTIDQVVYDYGDVCQSVTQLAGEQDVPISAGEFRTFNRCLDDAIADAVTSFGAPKRHS